MDSFLHKDQVSTKTGQLHYFGNQRHRLVAEFDEDYTLKSTALIGAHYRGSGTTHGYGGVTP